MPFLWIILTRRVFSSSSSCARKQKDEIYHLESTRRQTNCVLARPRCFDCRNANRTHSARVYYDTRSTKLRNELIWTVPFLHSFRPSTNSFIDWTSQSISRNRNRNLVVNDMQIKPPSQRFYAFRCAWSFQNLPARTPECFSHLWRIKRAQRNGSYRNNKANHARGQGVDCVLFSFPQKTKRESWKLMVVKRPAKAIAS